MKKLAVTLLLICLLSCKSTEVENLVISNSLYGVVFDKKSNPIQNAKISIKSLDLIDVKNTTTDIDGKFFIPELEFDNYIVDVQVYSALPTTVEFDHFDIENVLIIQIPTFEDLITDMEINLKDDNLKKVESIISDLEIIDKKDIYFKYLKAIYLIKTENKEKAIEVLLTIKNENYKYVDILLEDLNEDN